MKHILLVGSLFLGLWGTNLALAQVTPSFVVPTDLPGAGLRILLPARSVEEPLPPLERRTYRFRQGERTWTEERYVAREIWLRSHLLGQWRDAHGNRMRILQMRYRFPEGLQEDVMRSVYDAAVAQLPDLAEESSAALLDWVGDYLQSEPVVAVVLQHVSHPLQGAARLATDNPQRVLYVLRIAVAQGGLAGNVLQNVVVDIDLVPDADVARALQSFEERFLRSLDVMPVRRPSAPVMEPTSGSGATGGDDPLAARLARSRAEAHASVANLRNWQSVDIGDYVLLSDQRRGAHQLIRDLERTLGPMRDAFAVVVPPLQPIAAVGVIRLFAEQAEYTRYVGEAYAWSAGLWSPARSELVIRPVEMRHYQQAREQILSTIYHEAFHQYLSLATAPLQVCVWFNEGHAELFEASRLQRNTIVFEENASAAQRAIGLPLERLFALDHSGFYNANDAQRRQHYATAWALIYYLRRSAAADPQFAFAGFLDGYMQALAQTRSGPDALRLVLARYPLAGLQADFEAFWGSARRRRAVLRAP